MTAVEAESGRVEGEADEPGWEVDPDDEWGVAVITTVGRQIKLRREAAGLRVPEDLSIVLLASDPDVADLADPALDLLVAPGHALGRRGVEALLARLADPAAPLLQERIGGPWRSGGSVAAPRG